MAKGWWRKNFVYRRYSPDYIGPKKKHKYFKKYNLRQRFKIFFGHNPNNIAYEPYEDRKNFYTNLKRLYRGLAWKLGMDIRWINERIGKNPSSRNINRLVRDFSRFVGRDGIMEVYLKQMLGQPGGQYLASPSRVRALLRFRDKMLDKYNGYYPYPRSRPPFDPDDVLALNAELARQWNDVRRDQADLRRARGRSYVNPGLPSLL